MLGKEVTRRAVRLPQESFLERAEGDPLLTAIEGYLDRYTAGMWWRPGWEDPRAIYQKSEDEICSIDILHSDPLRQWNVEFYSPTGIETFKRFRNGGWIYFPPDYDPEDGADTLNAKDIKLLLNKRMIDFFGEPNKPTMVNHHFSEPKPSAVREPEFI